jgi:hypothetical protein
MTGAARLHAASGPAPAADAWVLPEFACQGTGSRGPRFADDVWDFRGIFPRTTAVARIDFTKVASPVLRLAVKEFLFSRLHNVAPVRRSAGTHRPIKATGLHREYTDARMWLAALEDLGVTRLADVRQRHLDTVAARWAGTLMPSSLTVRIGAVQAMAAHAPYLSGDRLGFMPWQGRPPAQIARHQYSEENTTPRIPEPVMARMLEAALFYVQTASTDLLAARDELTRLRAARAATGKLPGGQARARVEAFIAARREQGPRHPRPARQDGPRQAGRANGRRRDPGTQRPAGRAAVRRRERPPPARAPRPGRCRARLRGRRPGHPHVALAPHRAAVAAPPGPGQPACRAVAPAHSFMDNDRVLVRHAGRRGPRTRPRLRVHHGRR